MKRIIIYSLASFFAVATFAQVEIHEQEDNIDWQEDSLEIRTINDIIAQQQEATTVNTSEKHFKEVWGRRSYRNLSINLPYSLDPDEPIETGVPYNDGWVPKYKAKISATYSIGRSYRLHKTPIANMLQFNIDYTPFDFTISHYKIETKEKAYNSSALWNDSIFKRNGDFDKIKQYHYTTWNLEKYQADYGMMLGPSFTLAPFTALENAPELHHLKLHVYAHFGYRVSLLYMVNSETADANLNDDSKDFKEMSDNAKLDWGHGFYWSWGFSLTWKGIGLGYEHNTGNLKYKSIDTGMFGDRSYKFNTINNRLYISFRVGK